MFERINWRATAGSLLAASLIGNLTVVAPGAEGVRANPAGNGSANRGWPSRRVGGGSRSDCRVVSRSCSFPVALVPEGIMLSYHQFPIFLFYLPSFDDIGDVTLEFVLRDDNDRLVYEKVFTTNGREGILEFPLEPSLTFTGLESDRSYHWYLSIVRDPSDRSRDNVVEGWVKWAPRTGDDTRLPEGLPPIERVRWYGAENFPTEALNELIRLDRAHPGDGQITLLWKETIVSLQLPLSLNEDLTTLPALFSSPLPTLAPVQK